ncbi:MAG: arabinogalactan endo-1,4-beta-galactosidase [Clostridiales bacterium]|jgi:arabinogalactan endo-1,4-beta-galactosidase|nr:arabinogalactan endo-1,4-beta-galactosidase [Clostridiales bacterium]
MKEIAFSQKFAAGADVSWLPMMEATGFPFRNRNGKPQDCLLTLKEYGLNALRLRAWINPSSHPHSGHCSTEETLAMGLRGQRMGYDIMVDFHYGDTWRDPKNQHKPAAWEHLSFEELLEAVTEYTRGAVAAFLRGGLTPKWVQLGNETNPGLLLPDGGTDNFANLARIYNAGHDAVKAVSPETLTLIHLAEGNDTEFCVNYFDQLERYGCRFDMIGLSYYPWWLNAENRELIGDLGRTLITLPERFGKDVMVVETGGEDEKEQESYDLLVSVLEQCALAPRCKGMFYWEPQGAKTWSGYNLSAWRGDGSPTRAMDAYLRVRQP